MSKDKKIKSKIDEHNVIFDLLKQSLWEQDSVENLSIEVTQTDYEELQTHSIMGLPANLLNRISVSKELYDLWKMDILQCISFNSKYIFEQKNLPLTVPYVILKGTSAGMYYPHPELRIMGDIDIMTSHEDCDYALHELENNGYCVIKVLDREIMLAKQNIIVELHRSFSSLSEPEQAKCLDDLIIDNINPTHVLPDLVNGVVIIEHVYKHLEGGLGLRQIIDWMMFVDKCLPDDKWPEFEKMVQTLGLKTFTIVTTRMCELYLGLSTRAWCANADVELCSQLMEYIMSCGNFGNKRTDAQSISENVLAYARTPKELFQLLQRQGTTNWKAARKYKILLPFAWIYQAGRYISRGLHRERSLSKFKIEYDTARQRNEMFDQLGVIKKSRGRAVFKAGKYIK